MNTGAYGQQPYLPQQPVKQQDDDDELFGQVGVCGREGVSRVGCLHTSDYAATCCGVKYMTKQLTEGLLLLNRPASSTPPAQPSIP